MIDDADDYLVEAAAYSAAAAIRNPIIFWMKFWEAWWTI